MLSTLVRRIPAAIITMLAVSFFTYLIFFSLSPDPAQTICGESCTPERITAIRGQLGLDKPFLVQFGIFIAGIFVGRTYGEGAAEIVCSAPCIGFSFQYGSDVMTMITDRIGVTVTLAVGASILWLVMGIAAGLISALKSGTMWDKGAMTFALFGVSLPNYFVALLLQYVLVVQLGVLPFPSDIAFFENPLGWFQTYIMPWTVLALMYASMYARLTKANVRDTLSENYIRTARAKGLAPRAIITKHALRPSLTPLVTLFGMDVAALLGGALITETVFGLNGVGKLVYDAISTNDQPVIMGATLLAAFFVLIANILVDLSYSALDPRIRVRNA